MTQKLNLIIPNTNLQSSYKVYGTDATTISLQIRSRQGRPAPESRQVESERVGKAAFLSCDKRKTTRWDVNNLAPNWIYFLTAFFSGDKEEESDWCDSVCDWNWLENCSWGGFPWALIRVSTVSRIGVILPEINYFDFSKLIGKNEFYDFVKAI